MKVIHSKPASEPSEPKVPSDLRKTLTAAPSVEALWMDLTPIARRDWVSWIDSAKQPETRKRRIEQTRSKLLSGKRRPCCYAVVPMKLYTALETSPKAKAQWRDLTPNERRDFVDWIDSDNDSEKRTLRIQKTCAILAAGKRRP